METSGTQSQPSYTRTRIVTIVLALAGLVALFALHVWWLRLVGAAVFFLGLVVLGATTRSSPLDRGRPVTEISLSAYNESGGCSVWLRETGSREIHVVRAIRQISGRDIATSKALAEGPPAAVVEGVSRASADRAVALLTQAGAVAEVRDADGLRAPG